jgi:hypothetical protein
MESRLLSLYTVKIHGMVRRDLVFDADTIK